MIQPFLFAQLQHIEIKILIVPLNFNQNLKQSIQFNIDHLLAAKVISKAIPPRVAETPLFHFAMQAPPPAMASATKGTTSLCTIEVLEPLPLGSLGGYYIGSISFCYLIFYYFFSISTYSFFNYSCISATFGCVASTASLCNSPYFGRDPYYGTFSSILCSTWCLTSSPTLYSILSSIFYSCFYPLAYSFFYSVFSTFCSGSTLGSTLQTFYSRFGQAATNYSSICSTFSEGLCSIYCSCLLSSSRLAMLLPELSTNTCIGSLLRRAYSSEIALLLDSATTSIG